MIIIVTGHDLHSAFGRVAKEIMRDYDIDFSHETLLEFYPELKQHPTDIVKKTLSSVCQVLDGDYKDLVIVTYSEHVINSIGHMIYYGKWDCKQFEIIVEHSNGKKQIAIYTEEGVLENWPFGFLEPDCDVYDNFEQDYYRKKEFNAKKKEDPRPLEEKILTTLTLQEFDDFYRDDFTSYIEGDYEDMERAKQDMLAQIKSIFNLEVPNEIRGSKTAG